MKSSSMSQRLLPVLNSRGNLSPGIPHGIPQGPPGGVLEGSPGGLPGEFPIAQSSPKPSSGEASGWSLGDLQGGSWSPAPPPPEVSPKGSSGDQYLRDGFQPTYTASCPNKR